MTKKENAERVNGGLVEGNKILSYWKLEGKQVWVAAVNKFWKSQHPNLMSSGL
jgi:hypothetical protein